MKSSARKSQKTATNLKPVKESKSMQTKSRKSTTSELVHTIAARYDDAEQAEALVELLKRARDGYGDLVAEDVSVFAQREAFIFTPQFETCAGV